MQVTRLDAVNGLNGARFGLRRPVWWATSEGASKHGERQRRSDREPDPGHAFQGGHFRRGEGVQARLFASRPAAGGVLVATLAELAKTDGAGEHPATGSATGAVVETPTQDMPFKAVISTEGKIVQERFFASRPEAEAFLVDTLNELDKSPPKAGRVD